MSERRFSIPYLVFVGGTVTALAGLLLFFVVGCIAAPLDVWIGVPPWVTFSLLFGGPVTYTVIATAVRVSRKLPWAYRKPKTAMGLTMRFLVACWWHLWRCRGTEATALARFSVLHLTEAETVLNAWVSSRALVALFRDADPNIRSRATSHFRARVERAGGERVWKLTEEVPPETSRQILTEMLNGLQQPRAEMVEYAWKLWLSQGDEELWRVLRKRRLTPRGSLKRLAELALGVRQTTEQFDAATDPAVPLRVRRRSAEHCAAAGAAPRDPLAAAAFFLLAGNVERYRRLDADGSLLALVYRDLHPAERVLLRAVLSELGELELLRLIRQRQDDDLLSDATARPTGKDESRRLWRALLDEPLLEAVRHAERLEDWEPANPEDQELLRQLLSHDVDDLSGNLADLETVPDRDLAMPDTSVSVLAAAISPGGDRLTLAVLERMPRFLEFDLSTGDLLRNWAGEVRSTVQGLVRTNTGLVVLHVGNERTLDHIQPPKSEHDDPVRRVLATGALKELRTIRPHREGVVVVGNDTVQLRDHAGESIDSFVADSNDWRGIRALDCEPSTGRITVCTGRWVKMHCPGTDAWLLADSLPTEPDAVVMLDESTLVTAREATGGQIEVSRWTATESGLSLQTTHTVSLPHRPARLGDQIVLHRLGPTGVLVTGATSATLAGGLGFALDTRSMTELPLPPAAGERILAALPNGRDFVTGDQAPGRFRVRRLGPSPLPFLFDTPMSSLTLADLYTVEQELPLLPDSARPPVELLRDCLRYRFATEIALGEQPEFGTDYDIGLGEDS